MTIIDEILKERPVGTDSNEKVCDFLLSKAIQAGYKTITLQFDCKRWTKDFSYIDLDGNQYELFPSPFSQPFEKTGDLEIVSTLEELSISVLFVPGISVKMCQSERWCNSTKKMLFAC